MNLTRALPLAGLVLLAGVAAWRVAVASYAGDLATICESESRSGFTLRQDMPALTEWTRAHLSTPEGGRLYAALRDVPIAERGPRLRAAARRCAIAASYDALAAEGAYRADLQHLCSRIDLPPLEALDDPLRLQVLEEWIATQATNGETIGLGALLTDAPTDERASVLATAARSAGILSCETARTLEHAAPER